MGNDYESFLWFTFQCLKKADKTDADLTSENVIQGPKNSDKPEGNIDLKKGAAEVICALNNADMPFVQLIYLNGVLSISCHVLIGHVVQACA